MNHRLTSDHTVVADMGRSKPGGTVHDGAILNIGSFSDSDRPDIPAQHCKIPDTAIFPDLDIKPMMVAFSARKTEESILGENNLYVLINAIKSPESQDKAL
ncbi:MAG: hypothetical protein R3C61_23015 [Bacteroidia bacterium]